MTITILPGWGQSCDYWLKTSQALQAMDVSVQCIDLPGFGKEPYNQKYTDIPSIAAFVVKKLQENQEKTILLGHSFGGRVAAYIAANYPENIQSLILIGSPNLYHPSMSVRFYTMFAKLMRPFGFLVPESIRRIIRSVDYQNVKDTDMEGLFKTIINENQTQLLTHITLPTLLVWGEDDDAVPLTVAQEVHKLIKESKLIILDKVGHNMHLEKPLLLASTISNYAKNL